MSLFEKPETEERPDGQEAAEREAYLKTFEMVRNLSQALSSMSDAELEELASDWAGTGKGTRFQHVLIDFAEKLKSQP